MPRPQQAAQLHVRPQSTRCVSRVGPHTPLGTSDQSPSMEGHDCRAHCLLPVPSWTCRIAPGSATLAGLVCLTERLKPCSRVLAVLFVHAQCTLQTQLQRLGPANSKSSRRMEGWLRKLQRQLLSCSAHCAPSSLPCCWTCCALMAW